MAEVTLREIPEPHGIRRARTLAAKCFSDDAFFEIERERVFRNGWVCAGVTDELPNPGSWVARTVGGTPVLLVRDKNGDLRAFLNACRHRASPLCDDGAHESGWVLRCPYHAWIYRLDGSLAKAQGVGEPEGFDVADYSLRPVGVAIWRRLVFINASAPEAPFDLGPLAAAIDACEFEAMNPALSESNLREFNWKTLLENYAENYHTPFVHPEIDTSASEDYPMVNSGVVLYAWDRHLQPSNDIDQQVRATLLPGEPGWEQIFSAVSDRPYAVGSYLTIWPNLMINVFPDALMVMWSEPIDARTTRVERRLYARADTPPEALAANLEAHRLVHQQDVDICLRVQRSHNSGLNADGVLATVEERGVYFVHQHLRAALGDLV